MQAKSKAKKGERVYIDGLGLVEVGKDGKYYLKDYNGCDDCFELIQEKLNILNESERENDRG
jgi:hypothetical protein